MFVATAAGGRNENLVYKPVLPTFLLTFLTQWLQQAQTAVSPQLTLGMHPSHNSL